MSTMLASDYGSSRPACQKLCRILIAVCIDIVMVVMVRFRVMGMFSVTAQQLLLIVYVK